MQNLVEKKFITKQRKYVLSAYQNCQIKKLKCNEERPCSECKKRNVECIASTKTKKKGLTKKEQKNYLLLENILNR
ncbi:27755_t:CDS:1 [Racocetra persica]|uniref:27755_t:CDS:1 n=1 Tax=Racocetra persica TaxID=160502 RepID=A0ACA9SGG4_9GLOM|nr:27755_t:CDS:1 [Racocetra persica]